MGTAPQFISVIIPVLNAAKTLPLQLDALAAQTYRGAWEVLVADNGSTDGSADVALRWANLLPAIRVVDASDRRGINHARNVGAAAAAGDLLVFCDADDVATPTWLEAMADALSESELVGGYLDTESLNDPVSRSWRAGLPAADLPTALEFLRYAFGSNFGVRTAVFEKLEGFNETYAGGGDELEFCWRAQLANYRLAFASHAVMRYRYRTNLRSFARQVYGFSRAEPQLYRQFRDHGMPRSRLRGAFKSWRWLILHLPVLVRPSPARATWVRRAARRWGRLCGSVRHRVVFL